MTETVAALLAAYRAKEISVADIVRRTYQRIREANDPAIFISVRDESEVLAEADALRARHPEELPLYGIPIAIKDNIDVAGLATTAACPAFSYNPETNATAVQRLKNAGALIIGKTNLDQFATGLVGTRSPYGAPRNALRSDLVSGGSSSGSAVAVARGIVPLALGTDTAGSGRVPAGLNNIVGLKPTLGLVPTTGVVPACRTLDCVSIFALTAADAMSALQVMAGPDASDAFSRTIPVGDMTSLPPGMRIGVPRPADRIFLGDTRSEKAFTAAIELARNLGATITDLDFTPLYETARLLYDGPWVAERTVAVGAFMAQHPDDVHPITKAIIGQGLEKSALDTFRALYRLQEFRAVAARVFEMCNMLMVPTFPKPVTTSEIAADPIGVNSRLGTYTNFVNLLDMAGIAVPSRLDADGTAYGITLLGPCGHDAKLASFGAAMHSHAGLTLGALKQPSLEPAIRDSALAREEIAIAVVGAHMSGMALNSELRALSARFLKAATTTPDYRLFALPGTSPARPGLLRVADNTGTAIALEIWALSAQNFGKFVNAIPAPLSIGSIRIDDGRTIKGFLAEAEAVGEARDVSDYGGWRAYIAAQQVI